MCFVIPTYNEAENITLLLGRLIDLYPDPNTLFLVVDDDSPDGTGALVRQFAGGDARVHLLEGRKRGLGAAYVRGITHATDTLGADVVVQMDADFSHDPEDAGRLLARVATDADVAIGSRYVAGGAVDESWGFRRRQLSLWGNRMARWIAGLKGVRDCTAGFKAIRSLRAAGRPGRGDQRARLRLPGGAAAPAVAQRRARGGGTDLLPRPPARRHQARPRQHAGVHVPDLVAAPHQPSHLHQVLREPDSAGCS